MSSNESDAAAFEAIIAQLRAAPSFDEPMRARTGGRGRSGLWRHMEPQLHPVPEVTRGFRIRVDLQHTKPPVWRRIEVSGDITLPRLHEVVQAAMGWFDCHLHRFRTSNDRNPPGFITQFDLDEGDDGILEDDVRLDQVVAAQGDKLWYDYDFGDGWEHILRVEQVLDTPPQSPRCITGKLACPPEDCGGVWGYHEIATWVRSGFTDALRPEVFESTEDGRDWLPVDWHPDVFNVEETNELITMVAADPPPVTDELASLLVLERNRGSRSLRDALARPTFHGTTEVDPADAARVTEPFRILLEVIGDGASLTGAGYLKPADVEQIAQRIGITKWWIGKANREDQTWPVAQLRATARSLGLVAVRKGRISPTQAGKRCAGDPESLLRRIIGGLPLGKSPAERQAGWAALAIAGSEIPAELWNGAIKEVMFDLGWRDGSDRSAAPPAHSVTLDVLNILAGASQDRWHGRGVDAAVAAIARAATKP
ncbi:plasmid pRiA4b ORF-3 family protein [Leucobacter sp. W1478]|uniref:plasmid pRiA4b ORF-3 family protein n=1 Tax=Leucobacter sp. W1478 TaxID=3439065 RepID=UPI003F39D3C2